MIIKSMVSSATFEWPTPQNLFDLLDSEFHFTLDVCATDQNAKCKRYFTIKEDGLKQDWGKDICFMNPPFNRQTKLWIAKAVEAAQNGATVVAVIQVGTGRNYWHDYIFPLAHEIRFVRGFLKYGDAKETAPFASAVVIFKPGLRPPKQLLVVSWNFFKKSV